MSASQKQRAKLQASRILANIGVGPYQRGSSKKLWKDRNRVQYLRFELSGHYRLVVVWREKKVLFQWTGSHEDYNNLLPKLRRRRF